ncbi:MAG: M50 family metallopeptidase [Roseiflexaceae bacterium]
MEPAQFVQLWNQPSVRVSVAVALISLIIRKIPLLNAPVYPFYILAVFVHEISHGVTALLTFGKFQKFEIKIDYAGVASTVGGNDFLILQSGYLSNAMLGGAIFWMIGRGFGPRSILLGLGISLLVFCLFFARNAFGFLVGLLLAAAMIGIALQFTLLWVTTILWLIAIHMFINTFIRLAELLTITHIKTNNDPHRLAQMTPFSVDMWLLIWLLISGWIFFASIEYAYGLPAIWQIRLN